MFKVNDMIKIILYFSPFLLTTITIAAPKQKTTAQANPLFEITLLEKNTNHIQISEKASKDVDYRVCNRTKISRTISVPSITGIEPMNIGPLSCLNELNNEVGLHPNTCCFLKLRVDLRAKAALKRFSRSGKNNFPQVRHGDFLASQASSTDALTVTETTSVEPPIVLSGLFQTTASEGNFLYYPLIEVSTDNGSSWSVSSSTTSPSTTPPFGGEVNNIFTNSISCSSSGVCVVPGAYNPQGSDNTNPFLAVTLNAGSTWFSPMAITNPAITPSYEAEYAFTGLLSSSCTTSFCAATGNYFGQYNGAVINLPLTAIGTNNNGTWSWQYLSGTENLREIEPAYSSYAFSSSFSNRTSCLDSSTSSTSSFCINAAQYESNNIIYPLISVISNATGSWIQNYVKTSSYINSIPNYASFQFNDLNGASCTNENYCFVIGNYEDTSGHTNPLLLQSADASDVTSAWTYPAGISTSNITPAFVSDGSLNDASCSGNICIAAGSFIGNYTNAAGVTAHTELPLVTLTNNAGTTWNYQTDITSSTILPDSFVSDGTLTGTSCSGSSPVVCVAVGSFIGNYTNSVGITVETQLPLIALTGNAAGTSGTTTWRYPEQSYLANIDGFIKGSLSAVSCNNNGEVCVAAGSYTAEKTTSTGHPTISEYPLALISTDGGSSWVYNSAVIPSASLGATASSFNSAASSS
ncbi:MAG: hypothetical protein K0U37_08875 [Gammaproteobacteria bacterium]|nr:hypothetical protein [Gammaproteobacteria bacterium]